MDRRFATRIGVIRTNRFARIGSRESVRTKIIKKKNKKNYFHNVRAIRANRLKPAIRNL